MKLTNKLYDVLKFITITVLPAISTLIFSVFEVMNFNMTQAAQICGIIAAVTTFLGVILGISSAQYSADNKEVTKK